MKKKQGFSLIEIIISMGIFMIIGLAILSFQKNIFSFNTLISGDLVIQEEARRALKSIGEEIRSMSPSSAGAYPIGEAASTTLIFYVDSDKDGLKERIRYFLDDNILKKGIIKPSINPVVYNQENEIINPVINNVVLGKEIFQYYDSNYDGTTSSLSSPINLPQIRLIKITVSIDEDPSQPLGEITITTQITMRNLKDNL